MKLKIGTKVRRVMGCQFGIGTITKSFDWRAATDGTYKQPGNHYVPILWENGLKGFEPAKFLVII